MAFELAGGSTTGRDHRIGVPSNCQDAYEIRQGPTGTTALVADGCGSGKHSEVGAKVGVQLATTILQRYLRQGISPNLQMLEHLRYEMVILLRIFANLVNQDNPKQLVNDYFLFTLGGVILTKETALFFALGDGVVVINGETTILEPQEGNFPPYLSYALTGTSLNTGSSAKLGFRVIAELPVTDLQHFLIGTDGVNAILNNPDRQIPGTERAVGDISNFWTNDLFFRNPSAVTRHLNLMGRDWPRQSKSGRRVIDAGLLSDDTTIIVGRKLQDEKGE